MFRTTHRRHQYHHPVAHTGQRSVAQPFFNRTTSMPIQRKPENAFFQPKLTVGQPDDKYEKEADAVAGEVVNSQLAAPVVQQKMISSVQRMCPECEKEKMKGVQRMGATAEERNQKELIQNKPDGNEAAVSYSLSGRIDGSSGKGQLLPPTTLQQMQSSFGVDFSHVNIHTDAGSVQMNKELHAQAFTHGRDIYFNNGKYNPESPAGKYLLAHELTHVVQQGAADGSNLLSMKPSVQCQSSGAASGSGAAATSCGKPAECPADFCMPFSSTFEAEAVRALTAPVLFSGIAAKVSPRVVSLWSQYLFGGSAPQNLSSQFASDFTTSLTTANTTGFLVRELSASLTSSPPAFLPGVPFAFVDIPTQIPSAVNDINTSGNANEMNFNVIGEIPGNIAGGIGTTQLSCPVGARPSPFNDARIASGIAHVLLNGDGTMTVIPFINYTVKDTIDLCPGNCGASIEQVATVPMSRMEASGISGDIPFTVDFSAMPVPPFLVTPATPIPVTPSPSPATSSGVVTASSLRIREAPALSARIVGSYPNGTVVNIICQAPGVSVSGNTTWYQTDRGFISGHYVKLTGSLPSNC